MQLVSFQAADELCNDWIQRNVAFPYIAALELVLGQVLLDNEFAHILNRVERSLVRLCQRVIHGRKILAQLEDVVDGDLRVVQGELVGRPSFDLLLQPLELEHRNEIALPVCVYRGDYLVAFLAVMGIRDITFTVLPVAHQLEELADLLV